ncbi:ribbon-helix-helix domain-containing protein [Aureimonas psammosilenae]|uniref:ribbon-helix-helix domain-containing protein n=1 Tax=Aureimonas psammosilenae TaxID=2495496 RepID=UPI001869922C|nr:type II toxin-antitoxin system ParD family antitoxin [Aureimonas psammosilenae]
MTKLDVEMPDALMEWVASRVETGRYVDAGDYVRDLIRREQARSSEDGLWTAEVQRLIAEGEADIAAGRVHDIEEVFEEAEAAIREVERRQVAAE